MRMLVITYAGADSRLVDRTLDAAGVSGWTRIGGAHGHGLDGPREGTRAWPGEVTVWFTVVPDERARPLSDALRDLAGTLPAAEGLHVAVLPTATFF